MHAGLGSVVGLADASHPIERSWLGCRLSERDGAHQIVGKSKPEQDGFRFREASHQELSEPAIAGDRIDTLARGSSLLVDLLRLLGSHPLAPLHDGLGVGRQRLMPMA